MPPTFDPEVVKANQALVLPKAISSTELASEVNPLSLPSFNQTSPQELQGVISSVPDFGSIVGQTTGDSGTALLQDDLRSEILRSLQTLQGRDQAQAEAETAAGLPEQNRQLQELSGRLGQLRAESLAIPLQIQEEFTGRGVTAGGVEPIQTARLRQNAIQSLTLGAQAQALQGNIALAQEQVNRAVDLQFAPEENRLKYLSTAYEMNKDALEREDKQRADRLKLQIDERNRILEDNKEQQKGIYNIMNTVSSFGAPQSVVDKLRTARSIDEAISIASPYMQDPAAKQQLLNAQVDYEIKKQQLAKARYENYVLQNPQESTEQLKEASTVREGLNAKITILDAIKNSKAIDSVVGTNLFTRAPGTIGGVATRIALAPVTLGATLPSIFGGSVDAVSGERVKLISNVEQLISKEFLDNLINVKAQGATFGALTDREGAALRAAATKLGSPNVRMTAKRGDQEIVTGYNLSEEEFLREITTIQNLAKKAYEESTGQPWSADGFSPDEQEFWNQLSDITTDFNPAF